MPPGALRAAKQAIFAPLGRLLARRLWLPRPLYEAIPWVYLGAGAASLLGGIYLPEPAWAYPYLVLFGLACLHGGLRIASMRQRHRRTSHSPISHNPDAANDAKI